MSFSILLEMYIKFSSSLLQLDPPAEEPLYVIGVRAVHLYLRELSEIEDLGLDEPSGNGIVSILSDALNCRGSQAVRYGKRAKQDAEPWMDIERYIFRLPRHFQR